MRSTTAATLSSLIILTISCLISLVARLMYPEVLPIVKNMIILFYLILAVTLIATLRNLVGLTTYGVFGPAIVSLGLERIGDPIMGLFILLVILAVGLLTRFLLEYVKVQMTHRMAIVVITVSSTMGIIIYFGFITGVTSLTYASLLPILISSWIIERFCRHYQENGVKIALKRLLYTFIAIYLSFWLISNRNLTYYFIYTPELWVIPVAINLLLGSSIRIRLSEYLRFMYVGNDHGWASVLTMNIRNRYVIHKYNPRKNYSKTLKLESKKVLSQHGIPVPKTIAIFNGYRDLKKLRKVLSSIPPGTGFVLKPNNGYGGSGIMIVNKKDGTFIDSKGSRLTYGEIRSYIERILDGEFSRGWDSDQAYMEEILHAHPLLAKISSFGLPDIRIIVFRGIPIMAMIRIPTRKSNGKANLHQGAVGAGIDLRTGEIKSGVVAYDKTLIDHHPDTGVKIKGYKIPFWDQILRLAVKSQKAVGLGYVGVDITIDDDKGPIVMEVNKRPGMEIQNANREPLLKRIKAVEYLLKGKENDLSVEDCIRLMHILEESNWSPLK